MDVSDISARQRLAIGIALTLLAEAVSFFGRAQIGPDLGPVTRLAGFAIVFGVGFLGAALEPPLTRAFGADDWDALSTGKQVLALFVMAVTAIVLYGVVGRVGFSVATALG